MIKMRVTQELVRAWEDWIVCVPDDFPVDAVQSEQLEWLNDHVDEIEWLVEHDDGFDASVFVHVDNVGIC